MAHGTRSRGVTALLLDKLVCPALRVCMLLHEYGLGPSPHPPTGTDSKVFASPMLGMLSPQHADVPDGAFVVLGCVRSRSCACTGWALRPRRSAVCRMGPTLSSVIHCML
jgi:hypothetical protein